MRRILIALTVLLTVGMTAIVALAAIVVTTFPANAPSGTHTQSGQIGCTVGPDLSVTCSPFQLAGVGNTNVDVLLTASYSATIDCRNHGGSIVESHETSINPTDEATVFPTKNGRLSVPEQTVSADVSLGEPCPNPNWTPEIQGETLTLNSFTYTLTFHGFTNPYIRITGP
jgi:hypothetical protein